MSGIFVKYSSSSFFGIESDSPTSIRYYALALMNKALELDENIIPAYHQNNNDNNWKHKLLGINNAFTCTALLSAEILLHCKQEFPDIANTIIPPAWRN